jgi:hypothetical protein
MMGFFQACTTEKVCTFEQQKGGRKMLSPLTTFSVGKAIPNGLLPSRAHVRFTLRCKSKLGFYNKKSMLLTES